MQIIFQYIIFLITFKNVQGNSQYPHADKYTLLDGLTYHTRRYLASLRATSKMSARIICFRYRQGNFCTLIG